MRSEEFCDRMSRIAVLLCNSLEGSEEIVAGGGDLPRKDAESRGKTQGQRARFSSFN